MAKKNDSSKKPAAGKLNESKGQNSRKVNNIGDSKKRDTDDTGPRDKK